VDFFDQGLVRLYLKQSVCHIHLLTNEPILTAEPIYQKSPPLKRRATAILA
jgi:hypothetical protein